MKNNNVKRLWLFDNSPYRGYDTYDSIVVCALNAKEAESFAVTHTKTPFRSRTILGIANRGIRQGFVIASFNAG